MLAACKNTVGIEPKDYYLPDATIGKPYRQVIYLYGAQPDSIILSTWPDNTKLDWQFSRKDSSFWNEYRGGHGDAIEINFMPVNNTSKEIKIGIWATAYSTMLLGAEAYKEYVIRLVPDSAKLVTKP